MKATYFFNMGVGLTKGRVKKNWNFPDLVRNNPPTLVIAEIWKKMFLVILCMVDTMGGAAHTIHGAANKVCGVANTMYGVADKMHMRCDG